MDGDDTVAVGDDELVIALSPAQLACVLASLVVLILFVRARRAR